MRPSAWLVLSSAVACAGAGERNPAATTIAAAPNRGTVATQRQESSMIEVKADEAKAKGLPRIGFRVDPQGVPLELTKFPDEPNVYLIASGPPGAPLLAIVFSADGREGDAGALEAAVRRHHSQPWEQPLVIGETGTVTIGGASRPALAFMTGTSLSKTAWCGVLVSGQGASLLVTLGRAPGQAASMSCAEVVAEPSLAAFARTFALL